MSTVRANVEAISTLHAIEREERGATPDEQVVLARWSGWGAVPETFDPSRDDLAWARRELAALLSPEELAAAARNTLNAHYTHAELVKVIWDAAGRLGFTEGRVLEPGCGSGNFIGFSPGGAQMLGVELEPVTAAIARALYPDAEVLIQSFADLRLREGTFDLVVGNVPFGKVIARISRPTAERASSACSSGGASAPMTRWVIAAVAGPMALVRTSAGPREGGRGEGAVRAHDAQRRPAGLFDIAYLAPAGDAGDEQPVAVAT